MLQVLAAGSLLLASSFLMLVVTKCDAGWQHSQEVLVRNQTHSPLLLTFSVAGSTLTTDTVWWGIADQRWGGEKEIGYAVRLTALTADGLYYPARVRLPVLVTGTVDTLVLADTQANQEPWARRQQQAPPSPADFARGISLTGLSAWPDSVQVVFPLAPASSFLVARRSLGLHRGDPDRVGGEEFLLQPIVHWVNATGPHRAQVPSSGAFQQLAVAAQRAHADNYQLRHYLNYR